MEKFAKPFSIFDNATDYHAHVDVETLKQHLRENQYEIVDWFYPHEEPALQFERTTTEIAIMSLSGNSYNVHIYPESSTIHIEV